MKKLYDCFNWDTYPQTDYIPKLLTTVSKQNDMLVKDSVVENGEIIFKDNLHTNLKEVYHQVIKLKAKSVL